MKTHYLKTKEPYFLAIRDGEKNFEVRRDDRGFQRGDTVVLVKQVGKHSEDEKLMSDAKIGEGYDFLRYKIGWILTGGQLGIEAGYIVFQLEEAQS